ncbi:hypothetical protein LHP98_06900 [Rhodobacter sp. Har01]|uniref:hypothetical protein n=1 Tax=Rhodobacter sp. Har01 TaxID=2883999 RepID=UPI001D08CDB8|nr:hypothetical protein [Rhodobacter sp. Har01]MCB6177859.1 hypothetical protein [Rhodobacter sp. Har01]
MGSDSNKAGHDTSKAPNTMPQTDPGTNRAPNADEPGQHQAGDMPANLPRAPVQRSPS